MSFSRRKCLHIPAVIVTSTFASTLVGCSSDNSSPVPNTPQQPILVPIEIDEAKQFLPQSVATGDPRGDNVIV